MKENTESPQKKETHNIQNNSMIANELGTMELRFLISSKMAGLIIGKAGENIKNLRKESSVKINIPDSASFERLLVVEGELNAILEVLEKVFDKVVSTDIAMPLDVRLLVHSSQAGCVIGRGGSKIKELRENSGLKTVKVYQMQCPNSTDRVIQLVGDPDKVLSCISSIHELLSESPPKGNLHQYDTRNSNELIANEYGGWTNPNSTNNRSNAGGAHLAQQALSQPGATGPLGYTSHHGLDCVQGFMGPATRAPVFNEMPHWTRTGGPTGDATAAAMMAAGMMPRCHAPPLNVQLCTAKVSVNEKMIGAIMGRAGSRINQVRQESGAEIKISNPTPGKDDRIITIKGTQDQIQNAQFLLQVCVRKYGEAQI